MSSHSSYSLDVERLIEEIKNRPMIWDQSHDGYKNKIVREKAWDEVSRCFIEDYDEMSRAEKFQVYKKLFLKWRSIRDSYARSLRSKQKRSYTYANYVSFLKPMYSARKENKTAEDDSQESEEEEPKKKTRKTNKSAKEELEREKETWDSEEEEPLKVSFKTEPDGRRDTLEYVETLCDAPEYQDNLTRQVYPPEDEDRSFFESLLPAVRSFSLDQKLDFRSQIINVIKSIRASGNNSKTLFT